MEAKNIHQSAENAEKRNNSQELKRTLFATVAAVLSGAGAGVGTSAIADAINHKPDIPEVTPTEPEKPEAEVHEVHHHHYHNNTQVRPDKTTKPDEHVKPDDPVKPEDPYKIEQMSDEVEVIDWNGGKATSVEATVNGHDALLIDENQDGKADYIILDVNDNHALDEQDQLVSLHDVGMNNVVMPEATVVNNVEGFEKVGEPMVTEDGMTTVLAVYTDANGQKFDAILIDYDSDGTNDLAYIDYDRNGEPTDISEFKPLTPLGEEILVAMSGGDDPENQINTEELQGAEITVVSYEHVEEEGQEIDVVDAVINGHQAQLQDVNHDGYADLMWYDVNDDSKTQREEWIDLRDKEIEISLRDTGVYEAMHNGGQQNQPTDDLIIAQNTGTKLPRYNNDVVMDSTEEPAAETLEDTVDGTANVDESQPLIADNTDMSDSSDDTVTEGNVVEDIDPMV